MEVKSKIDINYLETEIIPQREKEIIEGKNEMTGQPIYVVLDLVEHIIEGHSDINPITNYKGLPMTRGYADQSLDSEDMEFSEKEDLMRDPKEYTKFYTDRIVSFFLTSKSAHNYLSYQSHNLSKAYVYVFYSGYGNRQMDKLLQNS